MGNPLIYYAQVPQPVCMEQCGRNRRKENPNCFVKAFRWYTEDHLPNKINSLQTYNKSHKTCFAAWLDDKYEQYLKELRDPTLYHVKMKKTADIESGKITEDYCEPSKAKKFRVKSPWRKKRRARSNETAPSLKKSSQSLQYLLQPKDISCHPSDCAHSSTTTVKTEYLKKTVVRSQSYSYVSIKDEAPLDVVVPQEGAGSRNNLFHKNKSQTCKPMEKSTMHKCNSAQRVSNQDCGCQCSAETMTKGNDVQHGSKTGLAKTVKAAKDASVECNCLTVTKIQSNHRKPMCSYDEATQDYNVYCECSLATAKVQQCSNQENNCCCCKRNQISSSRQCLSNVVHTGCVCTKLDVTPSSIPSKIVTFSTQAVQTSDCDIILGKEMNEYPLFLKIVCADKLDCGC